MPSIPLACVLNYAFSKLVPLSFNVTPIMFVGETTYIRLNPVITVQAFGVILPDNHENKAYINIYMKLRLTYPLFVAPHSFRGMAGLR